MMKIIALNYVVVCAKKNQQNIKLVQWNNNTNKTKRIKIKKKQNKPPKNKQEAHGPHRSPEKIVQINKHI